MGKIPKARARKVNRTEARKLAAQHVSKRMFDGATVVDGADARLSVYGLTSKDLWVVYKNPDNTLGLRSSDIVAICKRTGSVIYEGTAGDEG